jgi:hypothetical protein
MYVVFFSGAGLPSECDCPLCGPYDHLSWELEEAHMDRFIQFILYTGHLSWKLEDAHMDRFTPFILYTEPEF